MLTFRLFGAPEIEHDGRPLRLMRRKSRALLYYIAGHAESLLREELLTVFWMDTPRPSALQTLRTTLHGLRRALGPYLLTDDERVSLLGVDVDVRRFASQMASLRPREPLREPDQLQRALDLYRGDFLTGFALPDSQPFEDWMTIERERYRRLAHRGFSTLSTYFSLQGDYLSALNCLDRALQLDPLQEDLQRESIRLHYLAGDRPGAIRRYDDLRRLLDEQMGVPPMEETRRLYDDIVNDRLKPLAPLQVRPASEARSEAARPRREKKPVSAPAPLTPPEASEARGELPFVGRQAELIRLSAALEARKLALIEGEPGIGKTRLAQEYLHRHPGIALIGQARELEASLPYAPVMEALRSLLSQPEGPELLATARSSLPPIWRQEASRLLPELAGEDQPAGALSRADETRLREAVRQLLEALARHTPIVLFLDDLHWADASSLGLLGYLVRSVREVPLSFLATTRLLSSPVIPAHAPILTLQNALLREGRLERITLSRLDPESVREIAARLAQDLLPEGVRSNQAQAFSEWLQRGSEGNPYILCELVRHARQAGRLDAEGFDLSNLGQAPDLPDTITHLIQSRLALLSDAARRVLDAGVAAGREFDFEVAARAAGLSENAALDSLDELRRAGLVQPVENPLAKLTHFRFDHSLTMEVAYQEVGELRHRRMHRRVAESLESLAFERAAQAPGAQSWPEDLPAQLARHFSEGGDFARAAPYALRAGNAALQLAAWSEAASFFETALLSLHGNERLAALLNLGEARLSAGRFGQATEAFSAALVMVEGGEAQGDLNQIRLLLARSLLSQARFSEITALMEQVRHSERPEQVVNSYLIAGTALSIEGADLEGARRALETANELYAREGLQDPATLSHIRLELGSVFAQLGDLTQAITLYLEALDAAALAPGESGLETTILAYNNLGYHYLLLGGPDAVEQARRFAGQGISLARERGVIGLQPYLLSTLGEIALAQGDLDAAEGYFDDGLELAKRLSMPERIAGLTANLGLVAFKREQEGLAIHRLSTALGLAEAAGTQHLAAQIRVWLAPLLPEGEARRSLAEARAVAESSGRKRLLQEIQALEMRLTSAR